MKELRIVLPYLKNKSNITKAKPTKSVNKHLKFFQLKESFSKQLRKSRTVFVLKA